MNKNKAILAVTMAFLLTYGAANAVPSGPFGYDLQKDLHRNEQPKETKQEDKSTDTTPVAPARPTSAKPFYSFVPIKDIYVDSVDNTVYYSNPTINGAINKYKKGNYTGCLQELYSYIKKHPSDGYAYYYMGMAYTKIGEKKAAANCYQKTINCNAKGKLLERALKGRDCITGGVYCHSLDLDNANISDPLDQFINAPYEGNGFSPELQEQYKKDQLKNLQRTINRKENLNNRDLNKIDKFDNNKGEVFVGEKIAMSPSINSEPTNSEVMDAIDVLKRAGLNITTAPAQNGANEEIPTAQNQISGVSNFVPNQELQQLNMMLGNNNNNNDSMMNLLPYMMNSNNNGQKVDPQVIQAMMMNSMMNSLNSMNTNDDK